MKEKLKKRKKRNAKEKERKKKKIKKWEFGLKMVDLNGKPSKQTECIISQKWNSSTNICQNGQLLWYCF